MSVSLICSYCQHSFERNKKRKSENYYCSRECQGRHSSELRSDEYTMFRHMYGKAKSYAKRKYREFLISLEDIKILWEKQNGCCALSGIKLKFGNTRHEKQHGYGTASLDRKDSSKGYIPSNIQIIHKDLQDIKSDLPQDFLIKWACLISWYHAGFRNDGVDPPVLDRSSCTSYNIDVECNNECPF